MKKLYAFWVALLLIWAGSAQAQNAMTNQAKWMRYPAISPDGNTIVFTYKDNLYTVKADGGQAIPLSLQEGHESHPVWSPDGQYIAFSSDRYGNDDVFIVPASGGKATRLTYYSMDDVPYGFTADGKSVLFVSNRKMNQDNVQFPYGLFNQLYTVDLSGTQRPNMILSIPTQEVNAAKDGHRYLYQDLKGYEDYWRKHEKSSRSRDIWLWDSQSNTHTMLTHFEGGDREPNWAADQKHFYYLSEASGSYNVWKMNSENTSENEQLTKFTDHPVRFLSTADDGKMSFAYGGGLYTLQEGGEPNKVNVTVPYEQGETATYKTMQSGATEMSLSPNGKEIAFVVRGEVFVTAVESGKTKRITNTPEQERSVSFSPDGRKLVYAGERNNSWNIYQTEIVKDDEPYFYASTILKEKPLVATNEETFQPSYSPDGNKIAYLKNRTTLMVKDLKTGATNVALPGDKNYSYSDGDQYFQWSPDSKWLIVTYLGTERWVDEIGLVAADGSQQVKNLTLSGYSGGTPKWALEGNAVLYTTDRNGFRSHGSWGAETDVYAMFFNQKSYDRFNLSPEEYAIVKEQEEKDKGDKSEDKKDKKKKGEEDKDEVKPIDFQWKGFEDRKERLTLSSNLLEDYVMSSDGEHLYYVVSRGEEHDVWAMDLREKKTKTLTTLHGNGNASLDIDDKGENLFALLGGKIMKIDPKEGKASPVSYKAEMYLDLAAERDYLFNHMWRQVREKFYEKDLHGVDWNGLKQYYQQFLPYINNNYDFSEMMSEMLGELNASHTGCRFYNSSEGGDATASLGVFVDPDYSGSGLKIAEVIEKSPLDMQAKFPVKAGMIIEKIDGQNIPAGANYYSMLNHMSGKDVLLTIYDPSNKQRKEVTIKPISIGQEHNLLYDRWVKSRRAETKKLSNGEIGYVHIRGMNSESFRNAYSEILGRLYDTKAIIVDTRFNGGGWLHDDLATLLDGKQYFKLVPRGQTIGSEPQSKWQGPSAVLAGEGNYSDAHVFPFAYRALGIGKIIGMPVPGTGTAVWWERQIDPSLVFGIPQVGIETEKGYFLENHQLEPDVKVKNMPNALIKGEDQQLEKAVEVLMKETEK